MALLQVQVSADQAKRINELKDTLIKAANIHHSLAVEGFALVYNIAPGKDGKQELSLFEVRAPLDLTKLTQG